MKKLFVEKPRNNSGYRLYSVAIIEGIKCDGSNTIEVINPENFKPNLISKDGWQEVKNEAGPPRIPTSQETNGDVNNWRDEIIEKFGVKNEN